MAGRGRARLGRIRRKDGSELVVPNSALGRDKTEKINEGGVIEKVARDIESSATKFKTKWCGVLIKEGEFAFIRDRKGMPIGKGQYPEIKTMADAEKLQQRLTKGGQFVVVRLGRY